MLACCCKVKLRLLADGLDRPQIFPPPPMTQFYFQKRAAGAGLGTLASPWSQTGFDAAVESGAFRKGGADALAIIF